MSIFPAIVVISHLVCMPSVAILSEFVDSMAESGTRQCARSLGYSYRLHRSGAGCRLDRSRRGRTPAPDTHPGVHRGRRRKPWTPGHSGDLSVSGKYKKLNCNLHEDFFLIQKLQFTLFRQINTVGSFPLFTHFCRKKYFHASNFVY